MSYDPADHHTPINGRRAEDPSTSTHKHRRKYDAGLVAPPISIRGIGKVIIALVTASALSIAGVFYVIGQAGQAGCEQRQELAQALRGIIIRSEPRLREFHRTGLLTDEQYEAAVEDNHAAIKDLRFPPC